MLGTKEPGRSAPALKALVRESGLVRVLVPVRGLELAKPERVLVWESELASVPVLVPALEPQPEPELQKSLFLNFRRRRKQTT